MKTLIVNTYAGSLLLGADQVRDAQIIGSYEDVGFGAMMPKANRARFTELDPSFEFVDHLKDWPDQDLTDAVVLAHPPCAAFSQQNTSAAKRGVNTDAFECTRKVLRYSMSNGAAGIAIESVPGALFGAWDVYDEMAERGGYHVYRILKNSIIFGVPQFRERFWAVLIRKGAAEANMKWSCSPVIRNISQTVDHLLPGTPVGKSKGQTLDDAVSVFVKQLTTGPCRCGAVHGFDEAALRAAGLAHQSGHKRAGFAKLISPGFFPGEDHKKVCRVHVSPFTSGQPSVLAEGGFAPVLLGSSLWVYRGRVMPEEGYKAIMGFPPDYIFPDGAVRAHIRTFLSKGVCPPVATWILANVRSHLGVPTQVETNQPKVHDKLVEPGRIASFRPSKETLLTALRDMQRYDLPVVEDVEMRDEEDDLEA
jgi:site-specific DNA-cytosine methylase